MKFMASGLTVREQLCRRGRSLYEWWVRLGRRWWRTCWGSARMFLNRVSSASSASCDAVGSVSVSWYRLSRTARRTCASIRPLSDEVAKPHQTGEAWELGEHHWVRSSAPHCSFHDNTHDFQCVHAGTRRTYWWRHGRGHWQTGWWLVSVTPSIRIDVARRTSSNLSGRHRCSLRLLSVKMTSTVSPVELQVVNLIGSWHGLVCYSLILYVFVY